MRTEKQKYEEILAVLGKIKRGRLYTPVMFCDIFVYPVANSSDKYIIKSGLDTVAEIVADTVFINDKNKYAGMFNKAAIDAGFRVKMLNY